MARVTSSLPARRGSTTVSAFPSSSSSRRGNLGPRLVSTARTPARRDNVVTKRAKHWTGLHVGGETEIGKSVRASAGAATTFKLLTMPPSSPSRWEYHKQKGRLSLEQQTFGGPDTFTGMPYRTRRTGRPTAIWVHRLRLHSPKCLPGIFACRRRSSSPSTLTFNARRP